MVRTEILATGDELRCGALVDSNSAWLAQGLEAHGLWVTRHLCVGDDLTALSQILREMAFRAEVVLVTGGLGPTPDDLSAKAAALALGVDLELHPQALQAVLAFFQALGREMPESNRKQAMLPQGCTMLSNPVGTAPGFACSLSGCILFFLPGVPREMRRMFKESVLPMLQDRFQGQLQTRIIRTLSTFGLTESGAAHALKDFSTAFPDITLGFRVLFPQVQIKLMARDTDKHDVTALLDQAETWVRNTLGVHVVSQTEASMAAVVQDLLRSQGTTLAVAESCTGGLIAHWMTEVSGSSDVFTLGAATYANAAKEAVLGVPRESLLRCGAVSEEVAVHMAEGVRRVGQADYGLSTTGIAGPSGGTEEKPVGTVCMALSGPQSGQSRTFHLDFRSRSRNKEMFAMAALDMLRRHLLNSHP